MTLSACTDGMRAQGDRGTETALLNFLFSFLFFVS